CQVDEAARHRMGSALGRLNPKHHLVAIKSGVLKHHRILKKNSPAIALTHASIVALNAAAARPDHIRQHRHPDRHSVA
ncbi:hypothetical protein ACO1MU_14460, partial [Staphylococcus aureus]